LKIDDFQDILPNQEQPYLGICSPARLTLKGVLEAEKRPVRISRWFSAKQLMVFLLLRCNYAQF